MSKELSNRIRFRNTSLIWTAAFLGGGCFAVAAQGSVIANPALVSGPSSDLIDPSGAQEVDADASGATAQATLEARSDMRSYQGFSSFASNSTSASLYENILSFTDPQLPDVRFSFSGDYRKGSTGDDESSDSRATSSSRNLRMIGNNNSTTEMVLRIDFGDYTAPTWTANANAVAAAGFTLSNLVDGLRATAEFHKEDGTLLSSQTIDGADGDTTTAGGIDVYFGYESSTFDIGYILVKKQQISAGTNKSQVDVGLDDLAFTIVPEPAAAATVGVLGWGWLMARRRRV